MIFIGYFSLLFYCWPSHAALLFGFFGDFRCGVRPITTTADDFHKYFLVFFFVFFLEKISLDV